VVAVADVSADASVRVLIVDDDPLVRAALRMLLHGDGIEVVGEAGDGAEAVVRVGTCAPDVVLMDLRMPGVDGITATAQIRAGAAPPEVVVLTTFDADDHVVQALRAGAGGFLLKDTPPADIIAAVHRAAAGDAPLSPSVTRRLIDAYTAVSPADPAARAADDRLASLTPRELEIALAIGEGRSNAEVAARLYLSVPTVKSHVSAIFGKLGVTNRVQVALLVQDSGRSGGGERR
jgi:DNA-binding NarL/FixJ family response regulator